MTTQRNWGTQSFLLLKTALLHIHYHLSKRACAWYHYLQAFRCKRYNVTGVQVMQIICERPQITASGLFQPIDAIWCEINVLFHCDGLSMRKNFSTFMADHRMAASSKVKREFVDRFAKFEFLSNYSEASESKENTILFFKKITKFLVLEIKNVKRYSYFCPKQSCHQYTN